MTWIKGQLAAINQAFFAYGSPVTMGVFRIFVGTLAFVNMVLVGLDFEAWFTEKGYFPERLAEVWAGDTGIYDHSFHRHRDSPPSVS